MIQASFPPLTAIRGRLRYDLARAFQPCAFRRRPACISISTGPASYSGRTHDRYSPWQQRQRIHQDRDIDSYTMIPQLCFIFPELVTLAESAPNGLWRLISDMTKEHLSWVLHYQLSLVTFTSLINVPRPTFQSPDCHCIRARLARLLNSRFAKLSHISSAPSNDQISQKSVELNEISKSNLTACPSYQSWTMSCPGSMCDSHRPERQRLPATGPSLRVRCVLNCSSSFRIGFSNKEMDSGICVHRFWVNIIDVLRNIQLVVVSPSRHGLFVCYHIENSRIMLWIIRAGPEHQR